MKTLPKTSTFPALFNLLDQCCVKPLYSSKTKRLPFLGNPNYANGLFSKTSKCLRSPGGRYFKQLLTPQRNIAMIPHLFAHLQIPMLITESVKKYPHNLPRELQPQSLTSKVQCSVVTLEEFRPFWRELKCRFQSCDIKVVGSKTRFGLKISHLEWLAILVYGLHRKLSTIRLYYVRIGVRIINFAGMTLGWVYSQALIETYRFERYVRMECYVNKQSFARCDIKMVSYVCSK